MTYSWKLIPEKYLIEWHGFWVICNSTESAQKCWFSWRTFRPRKKKISPSPPPIPQFATDTLPAPRPPSWNPPPPKEEMANFEATNTVKQGKKRQKKKWYPFHACTGGGGFWQFEVGIWSDLLSWANCALQGGVAATLAGVALHCATKRVLTGTDGHWRFICHKFGRLTCQLDALKVGVFLRVGFFPLSEGREWGVGSVVVDFGVFGAPRFSVERSQNMCFKGFWNLWKENRGAPKTPNSTTMDQTPHFGVGFFPNREAPVWPPGYWPFILGTFGEC